MDMFTSAVLFAVLAITLANGQSDDPFSKLTKLTPPSVKLSGGIGAQIIGGSSASLAQFPWMVAIAIEKESGTMFCGGSLINPRWVLTSAHCLSGGKTIYVRVGSNQWQSGGQLIAGLSAWYHPSFNPTNYNNNIGVIQLTKNVTLSKNVTTIKLLPRNLCCDTTLNKAFFSGWGYTSKSAPGLTPNLKFYNATEMSNLQCINKLLTLTTPSYGLATVGSWIVSSVQCTTGATSPTVLTGDDGGPLIRAAGASTPVYQVGVLSLSDFLPIGAPAIFTRVCHYLDILQAHTGIVF